MPSLLNLWKRVVVELELKNRIVGGVPTDPDLIAGWVAANMPSVSEEEKAKLAEKTVLELGAAAEEKAEGMWTTFKRDSTGVYIEGRQVKAMFKEASNVLREALIKAESKGKDKDAKKETKSRFTNLKSKVAERLFVEDEKIYMLRDGKPLPKVDGNEERAIHVMTAQGPRTALKRTDFVNAPATLKFTLRFLGDGVVDQDLIDTLLEYSSWNGVGADRSQGNGLFEVKSVTTLE
jgi:hypothetical protein